tara:strand:+ start:310 stop:606 length:297 start_codon:yes stop_codon:yes gene_type:complete
MEYNNSSVGSACSYATLAHYNNSGHMKVPVPQRTSGVSGAYVVPSYGVGSHVNTYAALTHGNKTGSCNGFFNITNAYGQGANNCNTQYQRQLCNSSYQ